MTKYEELVREIATPRQYEAWRLRKTGMRRSEIAVRMGISGPAVSNLRRKLLKKIKKNLR